jgi:hypothetical protein
MRRLCTPRWLAGHVAVLAVVAAFLALGWWQVRRAAAGNMLSYGYAVQWPVFAGFVLAMWIREARRALRGESGAARPSGAGGQPGAGRSSGPGNGAAADSGRAAAGQPPRPGPLRISPRAPSRPLPPPPAEEPDAALDAYNRYLAWLSANPDRRPVEYPGPR